MPSKAKNITCPVARSPASPGSRAALREPSHDEISAHARARWEKSGRPSGRDTEIWLEAERRLRSGALWSGKDDDVLADTREMLGEPVGSLDDRLESFGDQGGNRSATSL
jgi:hypothetical protein